MRINIKTTKVDLTPSLRTYIEEKFGSLAKFVRQFDVTGDAEIWLEIVRTTRHHRHGDVFWAAADLRLPKRILRAEETSEDVRDAVDAVKNKLRLEIEKYKTRFLKVKRSKATR